MARSPLPVYTDPCGWNAMLPPRVARPAFEGPQETKFAIVGAGFTGLAAARRLAELDPAAGIVLLEGSTVGEGSSARNSGFANPRDSKIGLSLTEMDRAEKLNGFAAEGFDYLLATMRAGGFSCDLERTGRITGAATEAGLAKVRSMAEGARAHALQHEFLEGAALQARLGTSYYRAAIATEDGYLLQPAALVRGLADSLPPAVRLHECSPVLSMERQGGGWLLRTDRASLKVETVVLATNAAIKHFGHWRDGLVTIYTFAGITGEMTATDAAHLGAPAWGLLPAHRLGTTVRRIGARRLMVRSLYAYEKPLPPAEVRAALTDRFHRRYPMLAHVGLEYVWGGTTALTMNGSPRWGRIGEGLYGSAGCNGSGLVKGTLLGKRLAEMIVTGDPQRALQAVYGRANRIAPEPFRTLGFHIVSAIERRKAGAEM
jgi:glycine/D-amino acid oxidase-like deaminating enzyme